jgi:hypothetical protein
MAIKPVGIKHMGIKRIPINLAPWKGYARTRSRTATPQQSESARPSAALALDTSRLEEIRD